MKMKIEDIPNQDKAKEVMNIKNLSNSSRTNLIRRLTGLCCKCHEKPAAKLVMYKVSGAHKVERYCLEHFHYSEDKQKKRRKVKLGPNKKT